MLISGSEDFDGDDVDEHDYLEEDEDHEYHFDEGAETVEGIAKDKVLLVTFANVNAYLSGVGSHSEGHAHSENHITEHHSHDRHEDEHDEGEEDDSLDHAFDQDDEHDDEHLADH